MTPTTERSIRARYVVLLVANVASAGFGFATASLVAWQFGPTGFGAISLAASITTYAVLAATCGTEIHAVRVVAAGRYPLGSMASSVIVVRLALATLVYSVIIWISYTVPGFRDIRLLVWLFGLSVFTTAFDVSWVPQAIHRTNVAAVASLSSQGLAFLLLILLLIAAPGLAAVPAAKVVAEMCVGAGFLVWMSRHVGPLLAPLPTRELFRLLHQTAPIGGTQLLRGLALGSDLILLGIFVGTAELGLYAAAFKVFQLLLGLGTAYFIILLPRVAERAHDGSAMAGEIRTSLRRVLPVLIAGLVILAVVAEPVLRLLFGAAFARAAPSLRILSLALLANVILRHYRQILLVRTLQTADFRTSMLGGLVHLGTKMLLIPAIGIAGAAVGTLLGETSLLILQRQAAKRALSALRQERESR